jgi:hypothetical protein
MAGNVMDAPVDDSADTRGDLISSIPVTLTVSVQPINDAPLGEAAIDNATITGNTANQEGGGLLAGGLLAGGVRVPTGDFTGDGAANAVPPAKLPIFQCPSDPPASTNGITIPASQTTSRPAQLTDDGGFIEPFDAFFRKLGRDVGSTNGQHLEAQGLDVVVAAATTEVATPHS